MLFIFYKVNKVALRYFTTGQSVSTTCNCNGSDVPLDTTSFDNNLSVADDTVQKMADTIDNLLINVGIGGILPIKIYRQDNPPVLSSVGLAMWDKQNTAQFFLIYRNQDNTQKYVEMTTYIP